MSILRRIRQWIKTPNSGLIGFVIYEGPSRLDGKPIVVVATLYSGNKKTGPMIQTWILRRYIHPIRAAQIGADYSICGSCPLRGRKGKDRSCYVELKAAASVWNAYRRGRYPRFDPKQHSWAVSGRMVRMGSYGDPVFAPLWAWKRLLRIARGHTGYTHQWRYPRFSRWSKYVMASTHSIAENDEARALGWRTFRARLPDTAVADDEIDCPASETQGHRLTCEECGACNGGSPRKRSVSIPGHGSPSKLPALYQILS